MHIWEYCWSPQTLHRTEIKWPPLNFQLLTDSERTSSKSNSTHVVTPGWKWSQRPPEKVWELQQSRKNVNRYTMYSYCPKPSCLPLVGSPNHYSTLLTTTLYHPMVWMDYYVNKKKKKRSFHSAKTLLLTDWLKSCVPFSVANWCSNKYERRVLPLILVDHEVFFGRPFLFFFIDGKLSLTVNGPAVRWSVSLFFFFSSFTNRCFAVRALPSTQNLHFSAALVTFSVGSGSDQILRLFF